MRNLNTTLLYHTSTKNVDGHEVIQARQETASEPSKIGQKVRPD